HGLLLKFAPRAGNERPTLRPAARVLVVKHLPGPEDRDVGGQFAALWLGIGFRAERTPAEAAGARPVKDGKRHWFHAVRWAGPLAHFGRRVPIMSDNSDTAPKILDLPIGLDVAGMRREFDSLGDVEVPADRYWGAQTQRSLEHFNIGNDRMPKEVYRAYGYVKKAAAVVNTRAGRLPGWKGRRVRGVCD